MRINRMYTLVIGLFYPAVLGSILFNFIDKFKVEEISFKYFLFFLIITVYSFDYLYTATVDVKKDYSTVHGIIDIIIIILLFLSTKSLMNETISNIPLLFVFTKLLALLWEFLNNRDNFAKVVYTIFAVLYISIYFCFLNNEILLYVFSSILCIDILISWQYEFVKNKLTG